MSRLVLPHQINRRRLLKLMGAASVASAGPVIPSSAAARPRAAQSGEEREAVIFGSNYGGVPYTNWTGVRYWTNTGVPSRMQFEPLLDLDDDLMPAPGLAEDWEVVSNTLTRYHLRSDLTWSDGTPITAEDVVFSMNLTFHPDVADLMASEVATISGGDDVKAGTADTLSGVRALDGQTVEIETAVPDVSVLRTLALRWWAPLPKHVFENVEPADLQNSPELFQPPVVSGPFQIDRIETDKWYEMRANSSYWRGAPKLDKVTYVFGNIGDPVALASQERFHFYIANQPDIAAALADDPNYTVTMVDYIQPYRRQFNASLPKYADPRVRKAVAYALDRETLAQQIYRGNATPQVTDFQGELLDPEAEVYGYDPDLARQLLSDANWDPDEIVYYDAVAPAAGQPVNPIAEAEFAAHQQWLGDIGMKVEQRLAPDNATFSNMAFTEFTFDSHENPHRRYDQYGPLEMKVYLASEPTNYAVWENAEADALVQQAIAEADPERYVEIARQLSIIVAEECPYVPTKAVKWGIVTHKDFTGNTPIGEAYFAYTRPYDWDIVG